MDFEQLFCGEVRNIKARFPGFKIVEKSDSTFCWVIHWILRVLSGWRIDFVGDFESTFGPRLYVSAHWNGYAYGLRWALLRHERVHLEQCRRLGLGLFWLGWILFSVLYMLVLPAGLTMRSYFELEAYRESARCGRVVGCPISRLWLKNLFTGPSYFWMCFSSKLVDRWLDKIPGLDP